MDPDSYIFALNLEIYLKPFTSAAGYSLVFIIISLGASAFISASEAAFFSLDPVEKQRLENSQVKGDLLAVKLLNDGERLLATILLANVLLNVSTIILANFLASELIDLSQHAAGGLILQIFIITIIILLAGEILPKVYATRHPLPAVRKTSAFTAFLHRILKPFSSVLLSSTRLIEKYVKKPNQGITVDELSRALELTSEEEIPREDQELLQGIVKFGEMEVRQVMQPRIDIVALDVDLSMKELLAKIRDSGFSRIPVYKEDLDHVIGILYIKDLLPHIRNENFDWKYLLRPSLFIPGNKRCDDLLKEFRFKRIHMAIVIDEYGATSGLITLEDIIELIVGEINDEFDDDEILYSKLDQRNFVFEGKILLNDLWRILEMEDHPISDNEFENETLGGMILAIAGRIPKKGETVNHKGFTFTVESSDNRRIKRVKVTLPLDHEQISADNS